MCASLRRYYPNQVVQGQTISRPLSLSAPLAFNIVFNAFQIYLNDPFRVNALPIRQAKGSFLASQRWGRVPDLKTPTPIFLDRAPGGTQAKLPILGASKRLSKRLRPIVSESGFQLYEIVTVFDS